LEFIASYKRECLRHLSYVTHIAALRLMHSKGRRKLGHRGHAQNYNKIVIKD